MARMEVTFCRYDSYFVEVDDALVDENLFDAEDAAIKAAEEKFFSDLRYPVASLYYDDVDVRLV